ncbi:MAG TPA: pyridoxamine 5'-phosphate oxidase family protein [Flavitalea sp.]|nr:pyridoxamine 5'-phosphate oxidase family protein [Flavitalea sp.]
MLPDSTIHFLQEKIEDLRSALFFSYSNAVLKMPTTIVTTLKVDDSGQIWFFISRPAQFLQEFDKEFPARLDFFKKGKSFYLKINGKARIVDDPEEVNSLVSLPDDIRTQAMYQMVLVKLKIQHAEYFEREASHNMNWIQAIRSNLKKWLFNVEPGYRPYNFNPDSAFQY